MDIVEATTIHCVKAIERPGYTKDPNYTEPAK